MQRSGLKIFALYVDERLFDAPTVLFMFNNYQVTWKKSSEVGVVTFLSQYIIRNNIVHVVTVVHKK